MSLIPVPGAVDMVISYSQFHYLVSESKIFFLTNISGHILYLLKFSPLF